MRSTPLRPGTSLSLAAIPLLLLAHRSFSQSPAPQAGILPPSALNMMPLPAHATQSTGSFLIDDGFHISFTGYTEPRMERARDRFMITLGHETGILRWSPQAASRAAFVVDIKGPSAAVQQVGEDESYHLEVTPDHVLLRAANPLGALHGLQTFLQAVHTTPVGFVVSKMTIDDAPRFPWRGLMIDSGRHFMPPAIIKQNLDAMEAVKLNVLHWHVSEDQGFRIESKVFPKLQGMGSDGMFYTQDQVRDIVAYARDRGIRVYPEFEMPSHAGSFYVGYPELADGTGPYHLKRKFGEKWGRPRKAAEESSMDPTRDTTYAFLDKLVTEMATLFPDPYWHIGGDSEDAMTEWKTNPHIQQYMQAHGMKDTTELQAYFTLRLANILARHGKTPIGWDEVLQANTPKQIMIQSWRGLDSLATAARSGHRAILSWGYYLDLNEPASRHYTVDPLDQPIDALSPQQQAMILGGETAMWTEYVSPETIDGRIWPRAAAVAERLWSPRDVNNTPAMYDRLPTLSQHLAAVGLPFLGDRERMYQRMVGNADDTSLKVLASVVEPPKGFPREGDREYDVYTPLNELSDVIPAESDTARRFRCLASQIAAGSATPAERDEARAELVLLRDNDARLQPILLQSAVTLKLQDVSSNLKQTAIIGLALLESIEQHAPLNSATRQAYQASLATYGASHAELTDMIVPSVALLLKAAP
jgi:hexosaminidase